MIEIDVDESAAALVSLLEEHMREDGIWDYAVEFLVSMATDGASVMLGWFLLILCSSLINSNLFQYQEKKMDFASYLVKHWGRHCFAIIA